MLEPALKVVLGVYGALVLVTLGIGALRRKRGAQWISDFADRLKSWWWVNTTIGVIFISGNIMGSALFAIIVCAGIAENWLIRPAKKHRSLALWFSIFIACSLTAVVLILAMGSTTERAILSVCILLTQLNDIYQYCVGKWIGKHPLASTISPSKTIEGAVGGLGFTVLTSILVAPPVTEVSYLEAIILGLVIGILGTLGDLIFSLVKRYRGIKDFGSLLPGQGGLLDRLDSLTLVAPALFLLLQTIGPV